MKLATYCTSCKHDIAVKYNARTRAELQIEVGDTITVNCQNCGNFEKKHINKVRAQVRNSVLLMGFTLGVLVAILLWVYFGAIGTIVIGLPLIVWQLEEKAARGFNSYMIKRK